MALKQSIISYISVSQTLHIFLFLISENDFIKINFFLVSKNMNYLNNVLDSIY